MIALVRPSKGPKTQDYGNTQPNGEPHNGDDFGYTDGVNVFPDVYAAHDGVVEWVGDSRNLGWPNPYYMNPDFDRADGVDSSAGNMICLFHPLSLTRTMYSHLASWDVVKGQHVRAGERIAEKGETGNSRGKHLHFEVLEHPNNFSTNTYGRSKPVYTALQPQSVTIIKEWDEMATKAEIFDAVWGGPGTPLIHNNELGRGEYPKTILGAMTDRIVRQQLVPLRRDVAAQSAQITGLIGAIKAMSKGEPFDEGKLLAGVRAAAAAGVKDSIDSIETVVTLK